MRALIFALLAIVACGPPDVESQDEFQSRMEAGERARAEAVAENDRRELETSLRAAREQETIRSEALAQLTGQVDPDPDEEAQRRPISYEELVDICSSRDDQCVVDTLVVGPHDANTLRWLADAYDNLGMRDERNRVLRQLHGLTGE